MPDYKEMYLLLFRSITHAITVLQEAQQKTEETYISEEQPEIKILDFTKAEKPLDDQE